MQPITLPDWCIRPAGSVGSHARQRFDTVLFPRALQMRGKYELIRDERPGRFRVMNKETGYYYYLDMRQEQQLCSCPDFVALPEGVLLNDVRIHRLPDGVSWQEEGGHRVCVATTASILVTRKVLREEDFDEENRPHVITPARVRGYCKHTLFAALQLGEKWGYKEVDTDL